MPKVDSMARIMVTLNTEEKDALQILAERERRNPRTQAALLIRRALKGSGLLLADRHNSTFQEVHHDHT